MMILTNQEDYGKYFSDNIGKCILMNSYDSKLVTGHGEIREITKEELKGYRKGYNDYYHIIRLNRRFKMLKMNFESIYKGVSYWESFIESLQTTDPSAYHEEMYVDLNRKFVNFLASYKTLIYDIILNSMIPRLFGKNSKEFENFEKKTNEWYTKYFSYRFLIRLRDYAIHAKLPLQSVSVEGEYIRERTKKVESRIYLKFKKRLILQNKVMKRIFKSELDRYNSEFPLLPILEKTHSIIEEIEDFCHKIFSEKFEEYCNNMLGLLDQFENPNKVSFGEITKQKEKIVPITAIIDSQLFFKTKERIETYK